MDQPNSKSQLDVAIIGGGPAALSAGIYLSRAGLAVTIFERGNIGGALAEISQISNYPGFLGTGPDLAVAMQQQALQTGAKIQYGECTKIEPQKSGFRLTIDDEIYTSSTILIATGSEPKKLDFTPNTPVSYCALCDGSLVQGQNVAVVGGANSAVQEALYLANLAKTVTIISHSPLKADHHLQSQLQQQSNIKIQEGTEVTSDLLNHFDHVFVYIGHRPASCLLEPLAKSADLLDENGYILTKTPKSPHMTIIPGLFAAGDVRSGAVRQIITAAGDGAAAATEIIAYLR